MREPAYRADSLLLLYFQVLGELGPRGVVPQEVGVLRVAVQYFQHLGRHTSLITLCVVFIQRSRVHLSSIIWLIRSYLHASERFYTI